MPDVTIWVPEDLDREMRAHSEIDWRASVRDAIRCEVDRIHPFERLLAGSTLTEEDAVRLGREIRRAARARSERS